MRTADRCWEAMVEMAREGNLASRSDLEVGAKALEAGIWGASRNVAINLPGIEDEAFRRATGDEAGRLAARAAAMRDQVVATLAARDAGESREAAEGPPRWARPSLNSVPWISRTSSPSSPPRATTKKTEKVALIAALLQQAREREIELLALYLTGTLAQGRIGIGYRGLQAAMPSGPASASR